MRSKTRFLLILAALTGFVLIPALSFYKEAGRWMIETALNQSLGPYFHGTIRVGKVYGDPALRLHLDSLKGDLAWNPRPIPLEIRSIDSEPLLQSLRGRNLTFAFEGFRPSRSDQAGVKGAIHFKIAGNWRLDVEGEVQGLDLGDLSWLNPENLSGAAGEIRGKISFQTGPDGRISSKTDLRVSEPGGGLPSPFFRLLIPYLPSPGIRSELRRLIAQGGRVPFREASLQTDLQDSERMKVFFRLRIPDYNLDLNLNMEIRLQ